MGNIEERKDFYFHKIKIQDINIRIGMYRNICDADNEFTGNCWVSANGARRIFMELSRSLLLFVIISIKNANKEFKIIKPKNPKINKKG